MGYYEYSIHKRFFSANLLFRKLSSENSRLVRDTNTNTQIWESENEFLKNRNFDLENELKNLQFELLGKDDLIRQSVKKEDVENIQQENRKIVATLSFVFLKYTRVNITP